jgi:hypothetical protein
MLIIAPDWRTARPRFDYQPSTLGGGGGGYSLSHRDDGIGEVHYNSVFSDTNLYKNPKI